MPYKRTENTIRLMAVTKFWNRIRRPSSDTDDDSDSSLYAPILLDFGRSRLQQTSSLFTQAVTQAQQQQASSNAGLVKEGTWTPGIDAFGTNGYNTNVIYCADIQHHHQQQADSARYFRRKAISVPLDPSTLARIQPRRGRRAMASNPLQSRLLLFSRHVRAIHPSCPEIRRGMFFKPSGNHAFMAVYSSCTRQCLVGIGIPVYCATLW